MMAAESMMAKLYPWHQVAAVSGAVGIGLGAFGAHAFKPQNPIYKEVWKTASLYHLVHTAALLATPVTKHPNIFGGLVTAGILAFSGSCYTVAYFEDRKYSFLAPFGGLAFIAAWGSLLLCYTVAYFEDRKYSFLAPFGGLAFIAAWGSLLF